ncbi:MAG: hypothetical protein KGJ23_12390 [Euryarchaeota archaeon]|nr:hypothetical protein [Euryarchaeota archaeon]MDE1837396.1 hypothetical protein [Euryarchaeota archaeon]MDE1879921.1 hypothetical protein [Euryarchaeota archaeon]MDE2045504.1 hypothetical protein [Thermoplasmata archaeon]
MILDDLKFVTRELDKAGIQHILVGGASLERQYAVGTEDLDFLVALKDYRGALAILKKHPLARNVESVGTMGGCEFRVEDHWVDVELLHPLSFCGKLSPDEFIDYVRRHRSSRTEAGPVAAPEIAWYMRLAIPDWPIYVQKILRDVGAGVPPDLLTKVEEVAQHLGVEETLAPRIKEAREAIALLRTRPHPGSLVPPDKGP